MVSKLKSSIKILVAGLILIATHVFTFNLGKGFGAVEVGFKVEKIMKDNGCEECFHKIIEAQMEQIKKEE